MAIGDTERPTIFHEALKAKQLIGPERSKERLSGEAESIVMAGTLSVAWVFEVCTFHLICSPSILRRLKSELRSAIPDPAVSVPLAQLEVLPYLTAVIKETLRLTYGASGRLARVADEPLHYVDVEGKEWVVPPGAPIGMSNAQLHHDETIFPDSHTFNPSRWLYDDGTINAKVDRYLLSWQRGSRQCIGMWVAYAKIYLELAKIWNIYGRKGGVDEVGEKYESVRFPGDVGVFELYETGLKDVVLWADLFLALPRPESQGIRVRLLP